MRHGRTDAPGEPAPEKENWEEFGFEPSDASEWKRLASFRSRLPWRRGSVHAGVRHSLHKATAKDGRVLDSGWVGDSRRTALAPRRHGRVADRVGKVKSKIN